MYCSKHLTNVVLFPLCDARGVLLDALRDTSDSPATRPDALVFAWRLELPKGMNIAHAANALLIVAMSMPREKWSRRQLLIIRELMVLAGREEALPTSAKPAKTTAFGPELAALSTKALKTPRNVSVDRGIGEAAKLAENTADRRTLRSKTKLSKESRDWWKLVGRDASEHNNGQRKTRKQRVSREPK